MKEETTTTISSPGTFPMRDLNNLYALQSTLECALEGKCVPCCYKIANFDVAQDLEVVRKCPNQRPEMCPRDFSKSEQISKPEDVGYDADMNCLLLGDGDFSFSLALARMLRRDKFDDKKSNHSTCMEDDLPLFIATSYEKESTLLNVYPDIKGTIDELKSLGVKVCFQVDATNIAQSLSEKKGLEKTRLRLFQRIIWNFPCTAINNGQDGQNQDMEKNKELVSRFVCDAATLLASDGEIHMAHKTKPPYNQWNICDIALSNLPVGVDDRYMKYKYRVVLDRSCFPPYRPRKALDKKSFSCHDACIYIFCWNVADNHDLKLKTQDRKISDKEIMEVNEDVIQRIRRVALNLGGNRALKNKRKRAKALNHCDSRQMKNKNVNKLSCINIKDKR